MPQPYRKWYAFDMVLNPHYIKQMARTEPGPGGHPTDEPGRAVRSKSIPNMNSERLFAERDRIHNTVHTPEGLANSSQSRRSLMEMGVKGHMITHELHLRGEALPDCQFCKKPGHYE